MKYKDVIYSIFCGCALPLVGCAGPVSPFGGLEVWSGDGESFVYNASDLPSKDFTFFPKRQVLHKASDFKIDFKLESNLKTKPQIKVIYNNREVTTAFLKSAKTQILPEQQIEYVFKKLNLKPDKKHRIDVYWSPNENSNFFRLTYLPPNCSISAARGLASMLPFNPKKEVIKAINTTAQLQQLNPSLLAGLIAQESGFNPSQISRAKAVGLTQITSVADEEIKKFRPDWTSDPRIDDLSLAEIQNMVKRQEIGRNQDWRLNPAQAVEGGALYLNYLINYWNISENRKLLNKYPQTEITDVILASYNSGPARVKSKIKSEGQKWLDDEELKEAFKYVNSVVSYCYHFSETN